jgi:hypothetical protein
MVLISAMMVVTKERYTFCMHLLKKESQCDISDLNSKLVLLCDILGRIGIGHGTRI